MRTAPHRSFPNPSQVFDEDLIELEPHFRFYYDCLMRPNARSVLTALRKCSEIPFDTIAVGHGPLLRRNTSELVGKYQSWSEDALKKAQAIVSLFYVSDYGFNDRLAQSIARGLTKTDVEVHMVDLNLADTQEIVEAVGRAAAIVVTMPPSQGRAHDMLGTILASVKPKQKLMLAESFGGNDEPVDPLASSFAASGLELALPALRVKDMPSEGTYQEYEESGTDLGQLLTQKKTIDAMKNAMCPDVRPSAGGTAAALCCDLTPPISMFSESLQPERHHRRWPRRSAASPAGCTSSPPPAARPSRP